jgi:hypothetical protein
MCTCIHTYRERERERERERVDGAHGTDKQGLALCLELHTPGVSLTRPGNEKIHCYYYYIRNIPAAAS